MSDPRVDAVIAVMVREGGDLAEWHGWRCHYPDVYGPCEHNAEVAAEIVAALGALGPTPNGATK